MMAPLRVAIVGTGPAGMYALEHLLEERGLDSEVDLYDRLPTPYGLVRGGVAPDHPEKKLVIDRQFAFFFRNRRVRFFGNVEIGKDVRHAELVEWYDVVIYAIGADGDTRLGIPGEELPGCWAAREFVGYHNGHPDYRNLNFDLSCERAVIVGNGNVALDAARILTMPVAELERTDIADHALEALRGSAIREVVILGRRGHLQSAFSNPELEDLEHLQGVDVIVEGADFPGQENVVMDDANWETRRKVQSLKRLVARPTTAGNKHIVFRFLSSPIEILGNDKVQQVLVARNHLDRGEKGHPHARPTEQVSLLDTGLVMRAIGYRGTPFPGLPFDERRGVIRNRNGRVTDGGQLEAGVYVAGWIKRGCRGIIGSNKKCARETVGCLLKDLEEGRLTRSSLNGASVKAILDERAPNGVSLSGWLAIDHAEREAGRMSRRPRIKMTDAAAMLDCATKR